MFDKKTCSLLWDGLFLQVPADIGEPRSDQLQGTPLDRLVELAGRVCYDSLGRGRSSEEYHKHIQEVGHGSVLEHANLTMEACYPHSNQFGDMAVSLLSLLNRPGLWTRIVPHKEGWTVRVTANLRAILEWDKWPNPEFLSDPMFSHLTIDGKMLGRLAKVAAPLSCHTVDDQPADGTFKVVTPMDDNEIWASLFFRNISRGLSHELVRHGDFTAISQRSTRYCDEDESPWIFHPLFNLVLGQPGSQNWNTVDGIVASCRTTYRMIADAIMDKLTKIGTDKVTARKQARGAARGLLGNALSTEMVFSANMAQWKRMVALRAHDAADAEIRLAFNDVFDIMAERWPHVWQGWIKTPAKDGCGFAISPPT